eukprot:TRINITY_DN11007_c0_g1_i3.p1 TRINITY_DN11007_c0_g1~~TRINITY_DN11007_c0_g1_i3.p1  ORF type:complete len:340 (-),score=106.70 TRINITY_DN11007_c0_g1_i3:183-1202(-)
MNNKLTLFRDLMKRVGNPYVETGSKVLEVGVGVTEDDVALEIRDDKPGGGFDSDDLESFYTLISKVKLNCYKLRQKTKEHEQSAENLGSMVATADKVKHANDEFVSIQNEAAAVIRETKDIFDRIKEMCNPETGLTTFRGLDTSDDTLDDQEKLKFAKPEFRMVVSAKMSAGKNWADAVQEYTELDTQIAKEFRELHKRHFKLAEGHEPDEEELDNYDGQRADVFSQVMVSEADQQFAKEIYYTARAKEEMVNEVYELQLENRDLWASLGIAIEHHGQLLNNIYANVEKAQAYVKDGNENLASVSTTKSSSNKCRCFVLLALTVVAAGIIVPSVVATSG